MPILDPTMAGWLPSRRWPPDPLLTEMEEQGDRDGVPIVPPETGEFLHLLVRATGARRVVEVGTAIGVSTLYIARALPPDGVVRSFEIDADRHSTARAYLERAGLAERVDLRLEDAREGLAGLHGDWDLAFVDGVKGHYGDYLDLLLPRIRPGGVLAFDNALLSGTVASGVPGGPWTADHIAFARSFLDRLQAHPDLDATVLPLGDGIALAVRRA